MQNQLAVIIALAVVALVMLVIMIQDGDVFPPRRTALVCGIRVARSPRPSQRKARKLALINYAGGYACLAIGIILFIPMFPN